MILQSYINSFLNNSTKNSAFRNQIPALWAKFQFYERNLRFMSDFYILWAKFKIYRRKTTIYERNSKKHLPHSIFR
ncbi:hypothetical protein ABE26_06570 [Cytobacillus firmus]|nr:hypothetical protein [Cytobacillus firmus]